DLGEEDGPGAEASVVGASENGVYPALEPVGEIGATGDGARDSGAGVYPALTATDRLLIPGQGALRNAARWLATRRGRVAFAVVDERGGLSGVRPHARFLSASLTKAMILVAFLRRLEATGEEPTPYELLSLGYMIRLSDNASTDSIFRRVGDEGLRELATRAGMRDFSVGGDWANATVTPADQARLFMALDRVVPARFLPLARTLLETVSPPHSWGIPRASRPRWRTFFKGGWRPEAGAEVVHQAALVESGARRLGLAVMTGDDPSMAYGERTIEGVARRLLAGSDSAAVPTRPSAGGYVPGELSPLQEIDRFRAPDPPPLEPLGSTGK
ncbi:MAG: serine hydrolase, partial [Pseudonocardiaceae bacterium]